MHTVCIRSYVPTSASTIASQMSFSVHRAVHVSCYCTSYRSTSCNRGWLRLVVQSIFGVIIVSSFIMIVKMTVGSSYKNLWRPRSHCMVENCRVICNGAPAYGEFEDDIIHAIGDTELACRRVLLTLNRPTFINSSLPSHWLSAIRINVSELEIVGGNLQHIPSDAFMTHFGCKLRSLVLINITIDRLAADTFLGLSTLQELYIKESFILNIRQNALQAIDDTLQILKIKTENFWDPINVTGSSVFLQLRVVDLSMNMFHDILGRDSFTQLQYCRILYLNGCRITAIGAGAFDSLRSIEILHLNNNFLTTLPPDLFKAIIPLEPRISLQENPWNCSCSNQNLRMLTKLNLIIVDPTCQSPTSYQGLTFTEFENNCKSETITGMIDENLYIFNEETNAPIIEHENCETNLTYDARLRFRFPLPKYECTSNRFINQETIINSDGFSSDNYWLNPTFSVEADTLSMVALDFSGPYDYGLIWYKSTCPNEVYCINHLPRTLRLFNVDSKIQYTFCRVSFSSGEITRDKCVAYDLASLRTFNIIFYKSVLLFVCIGIISLLSGAFCVYALIQKNPILLKGNKRVVFVKHKTIDALILPPKIPLRCNLPVESNMNGENKGDIFVLPGNQGLSISSNILRTNSIQMNGSNDTSYISALQPSEDQLTEWRIKRQLDVKYTFDSLDSNLSTYSPMNSISSLPYYSLDGNEKIYDTVKM